MYESSLLIINMQKPLECKVAEYFAKSLTRQVQDRELKVLYNIVHDIVHTYTHYYLRSMQHYNQLYSEYYGSLL